MRLNQRQPLDKPEKPGVFATFRLEDLVTNTKKYR